VVESFIRNSRVYLKEIVVEYLKDLGDGTCILQKLIKDKFGNFIV